MKHGSRRYDYTCKSMWHCNNVGGLGEHVTYDIFWIIRLYYCCILGRVPSPHNWVDFNEQYVILI